MILSLSYPLSRKSPLYLGSPEITVNLIKSIERGDNSNNSLITFPAHAGTHIDLPRHFCSRGKTVHDLIKYGTCISPVYCYDLPKDPGTSISSDDIARIPADQNARGILIRTGFYRYRESRKAAYLTDYPWIQPDVPDLLCEMFPDLLLLGIDTISVSNPTQRTAGHEVHRSFLCRDSPIIILEDTNLSYDCLTRRPLTMHIFPAFVDELDGVPVTVVVDI